MSSGVARRSSRSAWRGLLVVAGLLVALWGLLYSAGWAEHTGLFAVAAANAAQDRALLQGVAYALSYLLVVPILLISGLTLFVLDRVSRRHSLS
jgi:hypothetical protein